jgi:hypothetical protein
MSSKIENVTSSETAAETGADDGAIALDRLPAGLHETVKALVQSGAITSFQRDGRVFVSHKELEAFSAAGSDINDWTKSN